MGKPPLRGLDGAKDVYVSGAIEKMCYAFFLSGYDLREELDRKAQEE